MKLFGNWRKETPPPPVKEESAFLQGDTAGPVNPENSFGQNRKILIVDDNPVVLKAFELKLKASGFQVLCANDGSAAVNIARHERPELIVLDMHFPPDVGSSGLQWNGFTIMQWMHRFTDAADIPVIVISSDEVSKFKDKATAAGAVACFQKPINHEEFLIAVRRTLGQAATKPPGV
jgi:CheY-like chemotaxis protein